MSFTGRQTKAQDIHQLTYRAHYQAARLADNAKGGWRPQDKELVGSIAVAIRLRQNKRRLEEMLPIIWQQQACCNNESCSLLVSLGEKMWLLSCCKVMVSFKKNLPSMIDKADSLASQLARFQ